MSELAYSLHLGSDKNRKNISKQNGKNNLSRTTSLPNNAIQNVRQLSKVDKHNYRKYDDNQELIEIVRGTSSPLDDVKELYLSEFEEARLEYNSKQSRPSRMIDNYFDNVSNNEKKDLACEIILELGDKEYWDTKDENFKKKMSEVYKKQVDDLELLVPNFKVASAIIHYDETSPHLHIVGVPIKYKNKNGINMIKMLRYAVIVIILIIGGVFVYNRNLIFSSGGNVSNGDNSRILVNEISSTGVNKIDADIKIQPIKKTDSYLSDAWVPDDLNKFNGYSVYTRDIGKSKYDNLNCYVYYFSNENDERNIRVAFSGKGKPIRDYGFDSNSSLNSTINNNELVIYKYENIYFVEFIYNNVNYDIETDGINIVELEMFLKSIIK